MVETVDIFPTLCDLTGVSTPDGLNGESLVRELGAAQDAGEDDEQRGKALSYFGGNQTLRTPRYRLIEHADGYVELYDHEEDAGETRNVADARPDVVEALRAQLREQREH